MVADVADLAPDSAVGRDCLELIDGAAPRLAWASGAPVEMILRQGDGAVHLTIINPDVRRAARVTVHLEPEKQGQ